MDISATLESINKLSVDDRIRLVEAIWDGIAAETGGFELTDAQKEELDRRIAEDDADPDGGVPWEVVKAELAGRTRR